MLALTILGSSSGGNCAYLETEGARLLIDAGFSGRQIEERLAKIGRSLRDVQGVFVTHEHSDHVSGLPVLAKRYGIPVYCNRLTAECLRPELKNYQGWRLFETGANVPFGDLIVETFAVPHDAYDPVGFLFSHPNGKVGFLTDLGYATKLVLERVRSARALVLEANHDLKMLQDDTKRPWAVKQRILSRHGHLSNEAAAGILRELLGGALEEVYLGHLSGDCNTPALARAAAEAVLRETSSVVRVRDTARDVPAETLRWE